MNSPGRGDSANDDTAQGTPAGAADAGQRGHWRWPEIITLVTSAAVVLGFAGVALVLQLRAPSPVQPEIAVFSAGEVTAAGAGGSFQVPFTVTNAGSAGATQVSVRLVLATASESPATVDVVLDVLPAGGSESGTALFARDPATGELSAAVTSYLQP